VYSTCHQYAARHRGGRSVSIESIAYTFYCIKILHIPVSIRTTPYNMHIGVKWLLLILNTLILSTFLSLIILSVSGFYFLKVMWLLFIVNTLILFTVLSLINLSASVFYFLKTPILLVCGVIPVYVWNMEVRKKYNISVRNLFGKMSEPGERNEGGGPGKPSCITTSNINKSFVSESSLIYFGLAEYSCVYPVLNTLICYTFVQYSYPFFDMCLVMCPMALCVIITCLLVTISNCSSRYGE
jgi:hypothetical protein